MPGGRLTVIIIVDSNNDSDSTSDDNMSNKHDNNYCSSDDDDSSHMACQAAVRVCGKAGRWQWALEAPGAKHKLCLVCNNNIIVQ